MKLIYKDRTELLTYLRIIKHSNETYSVVCDKEIISKDIPKFITSQRKETIEFEKEVSFEKAIKAVNILSNMIHSLRLSDEVEVVEED